MRLLNVDSMQMSWFTQDLDDPNRRSIPYATLSHTWGDEEVTFQHFQLPARPSLKGFEKILGCCRQAKKDGIEWVWVDTCCIDKTNSAELSEAVNSMYAWYQHSAVCYVLLEDVPSRTPDFPKSDFSRARWFTRGWCLQELIAPDKVEFYAKDWSDLGTKWSLHRDIAGITGIPREVLLQRRLNEYSIAQKMSWAARRTTTRVEDEAYCLLGIFDIKMPLIYGEGRKSFQRLQIEILKQEEDYSFLLWSGGVPQGLRFRGDISTETFSVLASQPRVFGEWLFMGRMSESTGELSLPTKSGCHYHEIESFHNSREKVLQPLYDWVLPLLAHRRPPQLMSRGLMTHMFVQLHKLEPSDVAQPKHLPLLWTEQIYRNQLVCIALVQKRRGNFVTCDRALADSIFLVDPTAIKTFALLDLHLTTSFGKLYRPLLIKVVEAQSLPDFEMHLPSKWNTTLRFIQSIPPIGFLTPNNAVTFSPPLEPRLYCSVLPSKALECRDDGRISPVLVKLQFRHTDCGVRVATGLNITLWLDPVFPRCVISASTNPGELVLDEGNDHLQSRKNYYDEASDRAECVVPGSSHVIAIMTKGRREPGTMTTNASQRSAYCTLHVAVLGNGY
ncbi:hypothetical protein AK830_g2634 [Neonectria ditissima]|uniref:Heterokaryon incompatibility domain-containing protein n=1 Tax=Neonectria ditissima TaxID=78410 RepID=A0A0P7BEH9_9HYPO|nr:hypothetical protein AK830_g2634 [Neonectria ditissima]